MRCKKHYTDLSSIVGVCACCLRERLLSVIAAQEQLEAQAHVQVQIQVPNLDGKPRNYEKNPAIPRSVSPYVHNRKRNQSDGVAAWSDNILRKDHHPYSPDAPRHRHSLSDQLFYRTPQVAPTSGVDLNKKQSFIRFLSFQYIFRSRNRKSVDSVSDPRAQDSTFREHCGGDNATSTPSWFSSIVHGTRHQRKQSGCVDESTVTAAGGPVRRHACRDRGMSPVRNSDVDEDELNNATSEYESATGSWKNTPRRTPARRGGGGVHWRNLSGLNYCLSPLVRPSPNRQWNQKGLPPDGVLSGEIRAPVKPHLSNTKAYCANRSRKIADFGRPNQNR